MGSFHTSQDLITYCPLKRVNSKMLHLLKMESPTQLCFQFSIVYTRRNVRGLAKEIGASWWPNFSSSCWHKSRSLQKRVRNSISKLQGHFEIIEILFTDLLLELITTISRDTGKVATSSAKRGVILDLADPVGVIALIASDSDRLDSLIRIIALALLKGNAVMLYNVLSTSAIALNLVK